jgi:uridine kinase
MEEKSPHIVGIAGGSCAGKTWLADQLHAGFQGCSARLSLDDFYRDRSHLTPARRSRVNFDHPRAIDWKAMEKAVADFAQGRVAAVPCYNFAMHGRRGEQLLHPKPILIVEGLWLFRRSSLRAFFDLKIFIRSASTLCAQRRVARDTANRGRTREQVLEQLERFTLPMFERFVAPQEKWADVVLDAPIGRSEVAELLNRVKMSVSSLAVGT